jgi:hypothetical protein
LEEFPTGIVIGQRCPKRDNHRRDVSLEEQKLQRGVPRGTAVIEREEKSQQQQQQVSGVTGKIAAGEGVFPEEKQ